MSTSRVFGKVPAKGYKPGFLDIVNLETLKMSLDRELSEISNAFYQTDETAIGNNNATYKGKWNPSTNKYPESGYENSWWDVETTNDADYTFDGKVWRSFQKLIYDQSTKTYSQVDDWANSTFKETVKTLDVKIQNNSAAITAEESARVTADTALGTKIDTTKAELNNEIASVQQSSSAAISAVDGKVTAIGAKWGVSVNVNDKITGISLNNDGKSTSFDVVADRFSVSNGTTAGVAPFEIVNGVTKIKNAVIGTISSDNWNGTDVGWIINKDGSAKFNNVAVKGDITATSGTFNGTVNANAGVFNNVTIQDTCTILGSLNANNLTGSTGSLELITSNSGTTTYTLPAKKREQTVLVQGISLYGYSPSGTSLTVDCSISINGASITKGFRASNETRDVSVSYAAKVPANTAISVTVSFIVNTTGSGTSHNIDTTGASILAY